MKYKSCGYIEFGLVLGNKQLQFCCLPHSDGRKGYVKICDYGGGPLPIETIRRERERLTALNNTDGVDSPCKGCWNLRERDWPELGRERPFDWIGIESFFACNLRCVYCDVVLHEDWNLPQKGYDLHAIFGEMLAQGWMAPGTRIIWGGGEPTVLRGFERIQELLMMHDVFQQLHTNAVRYSERIAATLASGKAELVCSVDAGTRATYARIKGGDEFERVWENLARYAQGGAVPLTLKYIVREGNMLPDDVLGFVRRAAEIRARGIALSADKEELHQDALSEEHALAYALMAREARALGLEVAVLEEYLPDDQSRLLGAMSDPGLDRRLRRAAARRALVSAKRAVRSGMRRLGGALRARQALRRAETCATDGAGDARAVLALFEHHVRFPNRALAAALVAGARRLGAPLVQAVKECLAIGLDADGWTIAERPAYVCIDNTDSKAAREQVLWVACYAERAALPLRVRLSDGARSVDYTYWWSERRRIVLPPVAAGELGIFAITTDRTWIPGGKDLRSLGVHLSLEP